MMQSDGQLSKSLVLPSSHVSEPDTLPLPHAGNVQLASQPGMLLVEQKQPTPGVAQQSESWLHGMPWFASLQVLAVWHSSGATTLPTAPGLPHEVQVLVQPFPSFASPSSHCSPGSSVSSGAPPAQRVVIPPQDGSALPPLQT